MRILAFLLSLTLLGVSPVSRAFESTVYISANYKADSGKMVYDDPICSGVVLQSTGAIEVIGTARHCTLGDNTITSIHFFDGDTASVIFIKRSTIADVAVIVVHSMRHHPALGTTRSVNPGDPLFMLGLPSGDLWSYNSARSRNGEAIVLIDNMPELAIESAGMYYGDSGAGVLDAQARVACIVSGGDDANYPAVGYCTPIQFALALL